MSASGTGEPKGSRPKQPRDAGIAADQLLDRFVRASPLLLPIASICLLVVGLWQHSEPVATLGAVGLLASLILPRMSGRFKIGLTGVEGSLQHYFPYEAELRRQAPELGQSREEVKELEEDDAAATIPPETVERLGSFLEARQQLAAQAAKARLEEARDLERQCGEILRRVADQRGWQVRQNATVDLGAERIQTDFAFDTDYGVVLVEATAIKRGGQALVSAATRLSAALARTEGGFRAILVVPDGGISGYLDFEVAIVEIREFERALNDLPLETTAGGSGA